MYYIAVQSNGERFRYEAWIVKAWHKGTLEDKSLAKGLDDAIIVYATRRFRSEAIH